MGSRDERCINSIRVMCAEMIKKANSGHPGICLGAAPIVHALFSKILKIDPNNHNWYNRDRFILSAGHGSALLYTVLSLSGYNISTNDLMNFRQKGSLTPGHPEYKHTDGVEMTTGPLGQGIATAVGMAIAEKNLANRFNKEGYPVIDHYTYVLCGDGDLQEGVALEALSLAGHLGLNKLIILYDSNDIQLDGPISLANSEKTLKKFDAMGFNTILVRGGNSATCIRSAIKKAMACEDKPTIIEIKTRIGEGSSLVGTNTIHGKPLDDAKVKELRQNLECNDAPFVFNDDVLDYYRENVLFRGSKLHNDWRNMFNRYKQAYPDDAAILEGIFNNTLTTSQNISYDCLPGDMVSTRKVSGKLLEQYEYELQDMIGGSADLVSSTMIHGIEGDFSVQNPTGRNINFGVREHAMGAIVNGLVLSNLRGFGSGFFVFSDYLKPSIRLAALMGIPSLFIFSHDSLCVGEDGPTHQPIEQLAMLRSIPNLNVVRPADAKEMGYAIKQAMVKNSYPTVIVTTRQDVPVLEETNRHGFDFGAYVAYEPKNKFDLILLSCGSELDLCIKVAKKMEESGKKNIRVVSMPSMFIYEQQLDEYKEMVLPKDANVVAVEMASTMPWYKYARTVIGVDTFGASMPAKEIVKSFGFTVEELEKKVSKL